MGSCVSRSSGSVLVVELARVVTAKVMDMDGPMTQFTAPVAVREALGSRGSSCFLCNSDELSYDAPVRAMAMHETLQVGQLYFVLPVFMLQRPLSGQDMAALAVKACAALEAAPIVTADHVTGTLFPGKNGDGGAAKRRQVARVAPLDIVDGESQPYDVAYSTQKTVYKHPTERHVRKGVNYRAGVQRLSVILEGSD